MSDFDGIENEKISQKLPPVRPGSYLLEVEALKVIQGRKGKFFVAEYKVLESNGATANEVGSSCSHLIKLTLDNAKSNVKSLVQALTREPENMINAKMVDAIISDKQPAKGRTVRMNAGLIKTKAGNDFTLCIYSPVADKKTK